MPVARSPPPRHGGPPESSRALSGRGWGASRADGRTASTRAPRPARATTVKKNAGRQLPKRLVDPEHEAAARSRRPRPTRYRRAPPPSRARDFGNHSETVLVAPGQLAASPVPSRNRKNMRLLRPTARDVSGGSNRIPAHRQREPASRAEPIEHAACDGLPQRVSDAEGDDDERPIPVVPGELGLQIRGKDAERLAVDVVDDGGGEEQAADPPAEVRNDARFGEGGGLQEAAPFLGGWNPTMIT